MQSFVFIFCFFEQLYMFLITDKTLIFIGCCPKGDMSEKSRGSKVSSDVTEVLCSLSRRLIFFFLPCF